MNIQKTLTAEELVQMAKEKGVTGTPDGIACSMGISYTGCVGIQKEEGITGLIGDTGIGSYTGYVGIPDEPVKNQGIGYTGLQEILKRAANGTINREDLMFYSGEGETEEEKEYREEINNLSAIWMLQQLPYGTDKIDHEFITKGLDNLQQQRLIESQKSKTILNKLKFTIKNIKLAIAEAVINFGQYLKGEVKYQQTTIVKVLVPCKKCKGLGFKKKPFTKKYDKGTLEYKGTFRMCKHCNGNGVVMKDISKKSVRYINKAIQYKRSLIEGAKEIIF